MSSPHSDWVTIAVLGRSRGNKGEVTAHSLSSRPERFADLKSVHLFGEGSALEIERVWAHQGTLVFKFRGVDSIDAAEKLRGFEVRVPAAERVTLDDGEFFHSDLVGCQVRDAASGRVVGLVTGFEDYGGPSMLEVDGGRILIPFVKAICTDIRPAERLIRVTLPEGLENLTQE
ncbi:MAG: ribosome maturation factor RimM [Acidobacteriota bacterium]|nr:ribosome maturation factor RimM [Acidobacteriota bacterium]